MSRKTLKGKVVSTHNPQTLVVEVGRLKKHPKYKKYYEVSKRYQVHVEDDSYEQGDEVTIEEMRPKSKNKRWRVVSINKQA